MPSGWLGNETNPQASFLTDPSFSNYFKFGNHRSDEQRSIMYCNVNGWLIPVAGTHTGTPPGSPSSDTTNLITLDPAPSAAGDFRVDCVFLEVWKARLQPNPSTVNKPSASGIWRFGNVENGNLPLTDDLQDPALGFPTEERIQIQYRIRVVKGLVGLTTNPDGFDPVVVKAQGAASVPTSYTFANMRQILGDPGLWRAGDGTQSALGTVDGYSYAVPICVVFRRNSVVWNGNPSQNLNGGFDRNPTAVDRTGYKTFSTIPTLAADLSASALSATLVSASNIPLPLTPATAVTIQIGDEIMTYSSITGTTVTIQSRGINGTIAEAHKAGSVVRVLSGRPDGLFSDQIASTDILDLRHVVNPNGFDYTALLKLNLDKLLRGQLRANWKRSGGGPQGPFIHYQDAIQSAAVSLGVTQLDAPDNIRMVFSDAATIQPIECVVTPSAAPYSGPGQNISVSWSLGLTVNTTSQNEGNKFKAGDVIKVPINQLKAGLQAGATDQIRWLNDSVANAVRLRLDGETDDLPASMYTVTPAVPGPSDDLTITFSGTFPTQTTASATPTLLHIRVHAVYGPGRGLSRRPDSLHSISYINPSSELLVPPVGVPNNNFGSRVAWAPLWSKYRGTAFNNMLPTTAEILADLGSKSVIVNPFRRINFGGITPLTIDGNAANPTTTPKPGSPTTGTLLSDNGATLAVAVTGTAANLDALVIANGNPGAGRYTIINVTLNVSIQVDRPIKAKSGAVAFTVYSAQGVMPLNKVDGITPKWTTTDPLGLFCGTTVANSAYKNIYVALPRHLIPGWGALYIPILANDSTTFSQGINFITNSKSGSTFVDTDKNYVNYNPAPVRSYASFSTVDLNTLLPLTYNSTVLYGADNYAGIRFFSDTRGLDRQGLELPPFYGIARLFAVYEAQDYKDNGSAFNSTTRVFEGGATNLLRQTLPQTEGPVVWIEIDDDNDSTFVLNANALDLSRSPNPISSFLNGKYIVEASIFGFDRGTFDLDSEARLVLTYPGTNSWTKVGGHDVDQIPANRINNINQYVAGPSAILPGPATSTDQILINYSRTPYIGDPWGSQTTYIDIPYAPGPLTSGLAYQVVSTKLDQDSLTRPNQKVLEVLASMGFATTLGTGRYSADASVDALDFKDVAYEDPTVYPPSSGIVDRPKALPDNFDSADAVSIGSEYLGLSERLPLGSLFRDKDFRGQLLGNDVRSPLILFDNVGAGNATSLAVSNQIEQDEVLLDTSSSGVGFPGDVLVHVDGEQGNYSLLTNFRTLRGGSVFVANGSHPGGEVDLTQPSVAAAASHTNVIQGRAMLVRNAVTNVGASEVSAGDELMMLIITTVQQLKDAQEHAGKISLCTNGFSEGYSSADLYRIEGHPLVRDNIHLHLDPSSIQLARRS
jgi:hypothetical protein